MNSITLRLTEVCPTCGEIQEYQFIQLYNANEVQKTVHYSMPCFACKQAIIFAIQWPCVEYMIGKEKTGENAL